MVAAFVACVAGATAALAHSHVKNPVVMARMDLMVTMKETVATLAGMVTGEIPFNATTAAAARRTLEAKATAIPDAFRTPETDPHSEALPDIWQDWPGFEKKSKNLLLAVTALDTTSADRLQDSFGAVGQSCGACHERYRAKK